jgi:hypothetical protein
LVSLFGSPELTGCQHKGGFSTKPSEKFKKDDLSISPKRCHSKLDIPICAQISVEIFLTSAPSCQTGTLSAGFPIETSAVSSFNERASHWILKHQTASKMITQWSPKGQEHQ